MQGVNCIFQFQKGLVYCGSSEPLGCAQAQRAAVGTDAFDVYLRTSVFIEVNFQVLAVKQINAFIGGIANQAVILTEDFFISGSIFVFAALRIVDLFKFIHGGGDVGQRRGNSRYLIETGRRIKPLS